jgi:hypothetical protein
MAMRDGFVDRNFPTEVDGRSCHDHPSSYRRVGLQPGGRFVFNHPQQRTRWTRTAFYGFLIQTGAGFRRSGQPYASRSLAAMARAAIARCETRFFSSAESWPTVLPPVGSVIGSKIGS